MISGNSLKRIFCCRKYIPCLLLCNLLCSVSFSQTIGGSSIYNFLKLPSSPHVSALGGVNISSHTDDISLVSENPSLLKDSLSGALATSFNFMYGGIKNVSVATGIHHNRWKTNFGVALSYFSYGKTTSTDASGNVLGEIKPTDFFFEVLASRKYEKFWFYGLGLKYIHSSYGLYSSSSIAADFGVNYCNDNTGFQVGFTAKNMGLQLKRYSNEFEDLPFDVQLGVSQKLKHVPLELSLTAHNIHRFDIDYHDTGSDYAIIKKETTLNKLFRHFILSAEYLIDEKIEISAGYNFLRAKDLRIYNQANGATGVSFGLGGLFKNYQFRYAMSFYQSNKAYHHIGINFRLRDGHF